MEDSTIPIRNGASEPSANLMDLAMLEKIDQLFNCGVGEYIDLPQIVVVGDQSSGKSSVLEGLTDLPFPRNSVLCTTFATKVIFRRSPSKSITVSIIPAQTSDDEHIREVQGWGRDLDSPLDSFEFANIFKEVPAVMGITRDGSGPTFSDDVLCLEVCGPDEEHLSVIDVPGIFQGVTEGLTTKEDIPMVRAMVHEYMANPRSVILLVAPANIDLANTAILDMANEVDEDGKRTLGVLTKPDIVDKGAEQDVMDIVEGRTRKLNLGWHILKNPSQKQLMDAFYDRQSEENKFFRTVGPYKHLDNSKCGTSALKSRLQSILTNLIRREFPKVKIEVNKRLRVCKNSLSDLGPSRNTKDEQFKFLLDIAMRFQQVSSNALMAKYWVDDIFDQHPDLRLATEIVNRNEQFSKTFQELGHTYEFKPSSTGNGAVVAAALAVAVEEDRASYEDYDLDAEPEPELFDTRKTEPHADIEDILHENEQLTMPQKDGIIDWLSEVYRSSRGFELGTFDPSLLAVTFKEQSKNWSSLSEAFVSDAVTIVHNFVTELLQLVCLDEAVRDRLAPILMDDLRERYKKAVEQVEFILQVERSERPATQNHYFNENLQKTRQARSKEFMEKNAFWANSSEWTTDKKSVLVVRVDDMMSTQTMSNIEHIVLELHDILQSYYRVARKRIVDVICMQAVEHHLISGPETPLKLFSPAFIGAMSAEQLEEIAGETPQQRIQRKRLLKEIEDLTKGKNILA